MHANQYAEVLEDDPQELRSREAVALDHAIMLLEEAQRHGSQSVAATRAIFFGTKLWTVLVEDLADPGNALPPDLRAKIISVGIWVLKELERLRTNEVTTFEDVIAVMKAIRDGLS